MKTLSSLSLLLVIAFAAHIADHMLGVVAFTFGYLAFCILTALVFGSVWHACIRKHAALVALAVFGVLAANFLVPPPSERLLRSAMLKAPEGTDASTIADIVRREYQDSPYAMPSIKEDRSGGFDRVHVSLLSQKAGSCTSAIFLVENGRVSRSMFSPD